MSRPWFERLRALARRRLLAAAVALRPRKRSPEPAAPVEAAPVPAAWPDTRPWRDAA